MAHRRIESLGQALAENGADSTETVAIILKHRVQDLPQLDQSLDWHGAEPLNLGIGGSDGRMARTEKKRCTVDGDGKSFDRIAPGRPVVVMPRIAPTT